MPAEKFPPLTSGKGPAGDDRPVESWAEMGSRIGSDNEALRNLLIDTGRRIGALDDLKDAFGKLVDPIQKTLRVLELEKSDNVSLRGILGELRSGYDALRSEFNELGRRSAASETEIERLRHELDQVQQAHRASEAAKSELHDEHTTVRGRVGDLERQLAEEAAKVRMLTDENRALSEHSTAADKRIVELEGETSIARERLVLLENEKRSLQGSLDQMLGDHSKISRRVNEIENAHSNAKGRLEQLETALAAAEAERNKLHSAVDEANERRQSEGNALNLRLEAMQSRATAAEKLLAEVRQSLISRTEEGRASERKVVETTIAKNSTDKKLEQMLASLQAQEKQLRDLETSRATLVERSNTLMKTVKARETALARSEEKVQQLSERLKQLETDAEANRSKHEKRHEDIHSTLQRERLERAVTEGALEATRKNYAELQRELAAERAGRREDSKPEAVVNAVPSEAPSPERVAKNRVTKPSDIKTPDDLPEAASPATSRAARSSRSLRRSGHDRAGERRAPLNERATEAVTRDNVLKMSSSSPEP